LLRSGLVAHLKCPVKATVIIGGYSGEVENNLHKVGVVNLLHLFHVTSANVKWLIANRASVLLSYWLFVQYILIFPIVQILQIACVLNHL